MTPEDRAKEWFTLPMRERTKANLIAVMQLVHDEALQAARMRLHQHPSPTIERKEAARIVSLLKVIR